MTLAISWRLGTPHGGQANARVPGAWIQVAQAVEYAGLDGLFIPGGAGYPDSFSVAAALCAHTRRLALVTSLSAEVMQPAALASAAQSLQSISHQRLHLHLPDTDLNSVRRHFGELLNRDQHSERIGEYLHILGHLLDPHSPPLDFSGRYFRLENAGLGKRPLPAPPILLDDSLGPALVGSHANQCLLQAGPPQRLGTTIDTLRDSARQQDRTLGFAIRLGLITHPQESTAWAEAEAWLNARQRYQATLQAYADPRVVELSHRSGSSSVRRFECYPNLWQPGSDAPLFLVGTPHQVCTRLEELHALGISHLIIEAAANVRDILHFGETLLPLLRERQLHTETPIADT